jgi:hypothetical protein
VNKLLTYAVMLDLTDSSVHTIHDDADRMEESAKAGIEVCSKTTTVLLERTIQINRGCESLKFLWHCKYINVLYRKKIYIYIKYTV